MISKKRQSGVLLHITSLPNKYGIGDIGPCTYKMIDQLVEMGQSLWQILPTNPPDNHNCPYSASSAFANNPYLISPELLVQDNLLSKNDLNDVPNFSRNSVDFNQVILWKDLLFKKVIHQFRHQQFMHKEFDAFCNENGFWLNDFALFQVLSNYHQGDDWIKWDHKYKTRSKPALDSFEEKYFDEIDAVKILQFLFDLQWRQVRHYAKSQGVQLIGDIPIYIAYNSVDVWGNKHLFKLNEFGGMTAQSGCPPDYFIKDGQVWGHPLYDWEAHKSEGYKWWINRLRHLFNYVQIVRIDHFNGFVKYWEIPATEKTGKNGLWIQGPQDALFEKIYGELDSPLIMAEDLGEASEEAIPLREKFNIPGMKILQMSLENDVPFSAVDPNTVVYTGTHDNDTIVGWYNDSPQEQINAKPILNLNGKAVQWPFIEYTLNSKANTAIIPMQDILGLDSNSRMNIPGVLEHNWEWRLSEDQLTNDIKDIMKKLTLQSNRV